MTGFLDLGVRRLPGSEDLSVEWLSGASPIDVSRVDSHVLEGVAVSAKGDSTDEARLQFIVLAAPLVRDRTRTLRPFAMRDLEDEGRRDEVFRRLSTTAAPISDENYFLTVTRYDDLPVTSKRRDQDNDSLADIAFGEYEDGSFGPMLGSKMADLGTKHSSFLVKEE